MRVSCNAVTHNVHVIDHSNQGYLSLTQLSERLFSSPAFCPSQPALNSSPCIVFLLHRSLSPSLLLLYMHLRVVLCLPSLHLSFSYSSPSLGPFSSLSLGEIININASVSPSISHVLSLSICLFPPSSSLDLMLILDSLSVPLSLTFCPLSISALIH